MSRDIDPQTKRKLRLELLLRDGDRCVWCSHKFHQDMPPTLDHVRPQSKGGSWAPQNLVLACRKCNMQRGSTDPLLWAQQCAARPNKPPLLAVVAKAISRCEHPLAGRQSYDEHRRQQQAAAAAVGERPPGLLNATQRKKIMQQFRRQLASLPTAPEPGLRDVSRTSA